MSIRTFIQDFFEKGVYPDLLEAEKKRIRLLNRLMFLAANVMIVFGLLDAISGYYEMAIAGVIIVILGYSEQLFVKHRRYALAKHMAFWLMLLTLLFMCYAVGNQAGANYMMIPLCMFPLLIFSSRVVAWIHFAIIFGSFCLAVYIQSQYDPILKLPPHLVKLYTLMAAFNMMLITYLFTSYARSVNESYEEMILVKTDQLEEAYKDITDSIAYAKRIQDAYLPPVDVLTHYFPESFLFFQPKDVVSGDFYWFYSPKDEKGDHGEEVFIAVADCTGHGVPGAIMSVICCNALNEVVIHDGVREANEVLDKVREVVIRTLKSNAYTSHKDGMDITLCRINKNIGMVQYAGANNPLWILKKGEAEMTELKPDKQPIGYFDAARPFSKQEVHVQSGDRLFLFSDGYADQFGGPKGKKFKYSNLQKLLIENSNNDLKSLHHTLQSSFSQWKGDLEQIDDVCVMGIRIQ